MIRFDEMFKAEEKPDQQIDEQISLVGDIARVCLAMEEFKSYRKQYEAAEQKMVQTMLMLTESFNAGRVDLTTYGAKMLVYMTRVKDLRMLLDAVLVDSKKGKGKNA